MRLMARLASPPKKNASRKRFAIAWSTGNFRNFGANLLPRMRAVYVEAAIETETIVAVPPLVPVTGSPAEALARHLTGTNTTTTVSFATEAGLYQAAGIPAIVCGPGSIDVAHKPDEFITRAELIAGQAFLDRLLHWARSGE